MIAARHLVWIVIAALAAAGAALAGLPLVVRLPLGLLGALVLPGLALTVAVLRPRDLPMLERLALAVPLSLAILVIAAPVLDRTPWGLSATAIVVATSGCTVVLSVLGWLRLRGGEQPAVERTRRRALLEALPRIAAATVAVGVLAAVVALADRPAPPTEFYVLGPERLAEGYPAVVEPGGAISLTIGITNSEPTTTTYRVVVESASARLAELGPIELEPTGTWTGDVQFTLPTAGSDQEVRILLLKAGQTDPFRFLRLWADVGAGT